MNTRLLENKEHNGIELYFESYPYAASRNILKGAGFKWHNMKKCWYARETAERREIAEKIMKREKYHFMKEAPEKITAETETPEAVLAEYVEPTPELDAVMKEAAAEAAKEPAKKEKKSSLQRLFDSMAKANTPISWTGKFRDKVYSCDSHRAMITTEKIEAADEENISRIDMVTRVIKDSRENCTGEYQLDFTAKELKKMISDLKAGKRNTKVVYCFENGGIIVNAKFLLEAMQATGTNIVRWSGKKAPILLEGETTACVICPINAETDKEKGLHVIS